MTDGWFIFLKGVLVFGTPLVWFWLELRGLRRDRLALLVRQASTPPRPQREEDGGVPDPDRSTDGGSR